MFTKSCFTPLNWSKNIFSSTIKQCSSWMKQWLILNRKSLTLPEKQNSVGAGVWDIHQMTLLRTLSFKRVNDPEWLWSVLQQIGTTGVSHSRSWLIILTLFIQNNWHIILVCLEMCVKKTKHFLIPSDSTACCDIKIHSCGKWDVREKIPPHKTESEGGQRAVERWNHTAVSFLHRG